MPEPAKLSSIMEFLSVAISRILVKSASGFGVENLSFISSNIFFISVVACVFRIPCIKFLCGAALSIGLFSLSTNK